MMLAPIAAMLAMTAALIVGTYSVANEQIMRSHQATLANAESMLAYTIESESNILKGCLDEALCDDQLLPMFQKHDRDALYTHVKPTYDRMAQRTDVSHFYFVDADRKCFLRMHRPTQYGEIMTRGSLKKAADSGQDFCGMDIGTRGTFTLRAIRPLAVNGQRIGYLEIGKDISRLTPHLKNLLQADMIFLVDKTCMEEKRYAETILTAGHRQPWNTLRDKVAVDYTLWPIPETILATIDATPSATPLPTHRATLNDRSYLSGSVPLVDAMGKTVGEIVILTDITDQRAALWRTVIHVAMIGCALMIALVVTIRYFINKVFNELVETESNLLQEIDHRRLAERHLSDRTRFLDTLIDTIPNPVFYKDENLVYRACNRAFATQILGMDKNDVLGKSIHDLTGIIPPDLVDSYHQHDVTLISNPGVQCYEQTVLCADRHRRSFQFYKATVPSETGQPAGIVGIMLDLTEQKKSSRSLERFRAALDRAADSIFLIDRQTLRFVDVNDVACVQLGYGRRDLLNLSPMQLAPTLNREAMIKTLDDILERRIPRSIVETILERRDGTQFPAEVHMHPMVTENEILIVATARDITDRRRAEEELKQADEKTQQAYRVKDEFLANISHELRTPMTAILGYADVLRDHHRNCPTSSQEHTQAVDVILRNGRYLLELVNDLLDLAKIEAGQFSIHSEACNPEQIVEHVATSLRVRAAEKHLSLTTTHHTLLPRQILSSPIRLQQILANLVVNAIKFTDHGCVSIETSLTKLNDTQQIVFKVSDTGIGISNEDLANIFEPFIQAKSVQNRPNSGTGLGLAISQKLAQLLGGEITVTSRIGEGSTFTLTLPVHIPVTPFGLADTHETHRDDSATDNTAPAEHAGTPKTVSGRILLAEDGPDNQKLLSYFLQQAGVTLTIVENGQQAIDTALKAQAEGHPFHLILMDMQMPIMDGCQATRQLRAAGYTAPIVALTAHVMLADREHCIAAGCDGFVTKPINRRQLASIISKYLEGGTPSMDSSSAIKSEGLLVSEFADDPDMLELIQMFIDEIPQRVSAIEQALESNDMELLTRLAHQLKGAAGGYGFPAVSDASKILEKAAKEKQTVDALDKMVRDLAGICQKVSSTVTAPEK